MIGAALALAALAAVIYFPVFSAGYIWDDDYYVTENTLLHSLDGLRRIWFDPFASPQYYPLVFTTFWIEHHLWGLSPFGYHLVNVLLHAASAFLLFRIIARLGIRGAFLAAAIFAAHPLFVESVAWVTERKNVLSGLFCLSSFIFLWRFFNEEKSGGRHYAMGFVLFLLALLSKTVTSTMPAAFLVATWFSGKKITLRTVFLLLPFFAAGIGFGLLTSYLEYHHVGARGPEAQVAFLNRFLTAGYVWWFYLEKIFFPSGFCFNYPQFFPDSSDPGQWAFPASALALALFAWLMRKRIGKGPIAVIFLYSGTLFPALGFINVFPFRYSVTADHFCYLPAIFPIIAFSSQLARLPLKAATAIGIAVVIGLGLAANRHAANFLSQETLYRANISVNPQSWFAYRKLAEVMAEQGRYDEAINALKKAIILEPLKADDPNISAVAATDLAFHLGKIGRYEESIGFLDKALALSPDYPRALLNKGVNLHESGDAAGAAVFLLKALEAKPDYLVAALNLVAVKNNLEALDQRLLGEAEKSSRQGIALAEKGDFIAAREALAKAVNAAPAAAAPRHALGLVLLNLGDAKGAKENLLFAVSKNPLNLSAQKALVKAHEELKEEKEALLEGKKYCRLLRLMSGAFYGMALNFEESGKSEKADYHRKQGTDLLREYQIVCGGI